MARFLLKGSHTRADMIQNLQPEFKTFRRRNVFLIPGEITNTFIDPVHTDRRKMVPERPEVPFRVREKPGIDMALDDLALEFKTCLRDLKQVIDTVKERAFIALGKVSDAGTIQRHNPERSGLFG